MSEFWICARPGESFLVSTASEAWSWLVKTVESYGIANSLELFEEINDDSHAVYFRNDLVAKIERKVIGNLKDDVTPREGVLYEAAELITGDRNKTYGSPTQNFQDTASIWTVALRHKLKDGEELDATDVAKLMIGLKLARITAQPKRDNWVDIAGYAGCGYEAGVEIGKIHD